MATTKDLSNLIDQEMGKGQGPFLVRICQDAGLLPKVKRGGWRTMKQLTAEHLADFVIAVAGTRAVGERNANGARVAVERFAPLICGEEGLDARTLREDIADFLTQYRDNLEIGGGYFLVWILFINDSLMPEAEIRLMLEKEQGDQKTFLYGPPGVERGASPVCEAVVIQHALLFNLGALLGANVPG